MKQCHPELGSGFSDFWISALGFENLGYKAPSRHRRDGRASLFDKSSFFLHLAIKPLQSFDGFFHFMVRFFQAGYFVAQAFIGLS